MSCLTRSHSTTAHCARFASHARRDHARAQLGPLLAQQSPRAPITHSASLVQAVCSLASAGVTSVGVSSIGVGPVGVRSVGVPLDPEQAAASKPTRAKRLSPGKWRWRRGQDIELS
jgi:hypothetical protein